MITIMCACMCFVERDVLPFLQDEQSSQLDKNSGGENCQNLQPLKPEQEVREITQIIRSKTQPTHPLISELSSGNVENNRENRTNENNLKLKILFTFIKAFNPNGPCHFYF